MKEIKIRDQATVLFDKEKNIFHIKYTTPKIDLDLALEIIENLDKLVNEERFSIIADFSEVFFVSKSASDLFASYKSEKIKCSAFIIDKSIHRELFKIFIKFSSPQYPTEAFKSREQAEEWVYNCLK